MIAGVNSSPERSQGDFSTKVKEGFNKWVYETPAITRSLIFVAIAGMVLAFFGLEEFLGENTALNTVLRVQIWRPLTAGFIGSNIISDVFAIWAISQVCNLLEPKKGSTFLLLTAVGSTVFIQVATVIFLTLVGISVFPMALIVSGGGFWPLAFVLIAMESKTSTNPSRQLMCLPIEVPTRYYAAILAVIFFILSGLRSMDIFMGLGLGYALGAFTQLQFSTGLCGYIESRESMKFITDLQGYVTIDRIGFLMQPGDSAQEMNHFGSVYRTPSNSNRASFKPFSGVGHKLGTASPTGLSDSNQFEGDTNRLLRGHPLADKYSLTSAIEVPINDADNSNRKSPSDKVLQEYII